MDPMNDRATKTVSVLIVDDQKPFRDVANTVVRMTAGFAVTGEAESAEDAIDVRAGAEVQFYQNISPLDTITARVTQTGYETENTVDAGLAYVLKAQFDPGTEPPRLGLRGTARIYGEKVPLGRLMAALEETGPAAVLSR